MVGCEYENLYLVSEFKGLCPPKQPVTVLLTSREHLRALCRSSGDALVAMIQNSHRCHVLQVPESCFYW